MKYPTNCPACHTPTKLAPGIGPYCPNRDCDRADDLSPVVEQGENMTDQKELVLTALRGYDPCPHCCGRASEGAAYDEHQAEVKAMSVLADAIERGEVSIGIQE